MCERPMSHSRRSQPCLGHNSSTSHSTLHVTSRTSVNRQAHYESDQPTCDSDDADYEFRTDMARSLGRASASHRSPRRRRTYGCRYPTARDCLSLCYSQWHVIHSHWGPFPGPHPFSTPIPHTRWFPLVPCSAFQCFVDAVEWAAEQQLSSVVRKR